MNSIALLGYITEGHHLSHCQLLLNAGFNGRLIVTHAFYDRLCLELLRPLPIDCVFFVSDFSTNQELLRETRDIAESEGIEEIFTTSLDKFWKLLFLRSLFNQPWLTRKCKFSGIWNTANFFYLSAGSLKRITALKILTVLARAACRGNSRMLFFNESLHAYLNEHSSLPSRIIQWCPDPYQSLPELDGFSCLADSRPVLLMAGHHKPRKGTQWALEAFLNWDGPEILIQIVGQISDLPDLELVGSNLPKSVGLEIVNRRVSEKELIGYYSHCTAVLLPYRHFGGSSGIFVNAVAYGKPVVASDWGVIATRIQQYGLGAVFKHSSPSDFLHSVHGVLSGGSSTSRESGRIDYLFANSPSEFARCVFGWHRG